MHSINDITRRIEINIKHIQAWDYHFISDCNKWIDVFMVLWIMQYDYVGCMVIGISWYGCLCAHAPVCTVGILRRSWPDLQQIPFACKKQDAERKKVLFMCLKLVQSLSVSSNLSSVRIMHFRLQYQWELILLCIEVHINVWVLASIVLCNWHIIRNLIDDWSKSSCSCTPVY